ncbi:CUE domain-containing protein 2-like [Sycon ciliatum]|uniref:CUE domain-containing protein 2-like n=1 Tax=Sycon ciliatum TaxID=27933 RepID=UPI0031F61CAC
MEQVVESLLRKFVQTHLSEEDGETEIEDVLLTYVTGILDGIASGEPEDDFDVDEFADVMAAYLPGFDSIDRAQVYEWIFSACNSMKEPLAEASCVPEQSVPTETVQHSKKPSEQCSVQKTNDACASKSHKEATCSEGDVGTGLDSLALGVECKRLKKREKKTRGDASSAQPTSSKSSRPMHDSSSSPVVISASIDDENCIMLQDMFPDIGLETLHRALLEADGVLEQAIGALLERQSEQVELVVPRRTSDSSTASPPNQPSSLSKSPPARGGGLVAPAREDTQDAARIKDFVLGKYMHVDEAEDERQHRPHLQVAAKSKQKTMYRDNHVVSTKGERYSVITKKDQEDEHLKKTYVSIKPLRKYRFH